MALCDLDRHRKLGEPRTGELIRERGECCSRCDRYVWDVADAFGVKVPIIARARRGR